MKECTKAMRRRFQEHRAGGFPWRDIFKGDMIDIGSGDDPLPFATSFNLPDGAGDSLLDVFPDRKFDLVHGSQVLEHAISPEVMLRSWIQCLKPGGHVVATVPDWELYEKETWPSKFNSGHRSVWTMNGGVPVFNAMQAGVTRICILPAWLEKFDADILLCRLVDTNYDYNAKPELDQTYDPENGVECFLEFVLRAR
jgi:SAM-dependent methyltransferase